MVVLFFLCMGVSPSYAILSLYCGTKATNNTGFEEVSEFSDQMPSAKTTDEII